MYSLGNIRRGKVQIKVSFQPFHSKPGESPRAGHPTSTGRNPIPQNKTSPPPQPSPRSPNRFGRLCGVHSCVTANHNNRGVAHNRRKSPQLSRSLPRSRYRTPLIPNVDACIASGLPITRQSSRRLIIFTSNYGKTGAHMGNRCY